MASNNNGLESHNKSIKLALEYNNEHLSILFGKMISFYSKFIDDK